MAAATRRPSNAPNGVQLTRVGVWYLVATSIVAVAAINTGNNGLFLTVAALLAGLLVAHVMAASNVRGLEVSIDAPREIFANQPSSLGVSVAKRGRLLPARLIAVTLQARDLASGRESPSVGPSAVPSADGLGLLHVSSWLTPQIDAGEHQQGRLETLWKRRGRHRVTMAEVSSLYPIGLFRKGRRHPQELELMVYPAVFMSSDLREVESGNSGDISARRAGWGHDLHTLRRYRAGDDPRGIHWKQSARHQRLIYQQRQTERQKRLRIVFDNAVGNAEGQLENDEERSRFEHLVSEAATLAVDGLDRDYDVALITRNIDLPYARGPRHRRRLLESLALIEPVAATLGAWQVDDDGGLQLRLDSSAQPPARGVEVA